MKRKLLLILAALFLLIAGIQNAMAQNVTLYSEGNKVYECSVSQLDSIVFSEAPTTIETEEIVVTIDANGNADDEHLFTKIDESNFYIDDIKYTANQGVLSVTGYNASFFRGEAKIINTLVYQGRKLKVTSIGKEAFKGCKVLTSVVIPNSVTSIGESAFHSCSGLTSVTIPNSVTSIGSFAFYGCSSLTSVTLNSETIVSSSRMSAIFGSQVKIYIIGDEVTSIGDEAFRGCSGLTSITIPNSVTSIGNYAFQYCSGLKYVYCYAINPPYAEYSFYNYCCPLNFLVCYKIRLKSEGGFQPFCYLCFCHKTSIT